MRLGGRVNDLAPEEAGDILQVLKTSLYRKCPGDVKKKDKKLLPNLLGRFAGAPKGVRGRRAQAGGSSRRSEPSSKEGVTSEKNGAADPPKSAAPGIPGRKPLNFRERGWERMKVEG
jgi:hypothetical protein